MNSLHKDMRLLPLAILLILLLVVPCGCRRTPDTRLTAAEVLVEEHPDSALLILDSVDAGALRGESDRALYAMLLTMAQAKCSLNPTDDSLITVAADYYREHDDPKRGAVSSYYQGRVYYLRDSLPAALVSYLRAKDLAERHDDPFWAGMACRGIAEVYQDMGNYGTQLTYARKQKDYMLRSGKQPYADFALLNYASALHNAERVDSALTMTEKALEAARRNEDGILYYMSVRQKVQGLIAKGRFDEAEPLLQEIWEAGVAQPSDSMNLAWSIYEAGNRRKALDMLDTLTGDGRPMTHVLAARYYNDLHDYKRTVRELYALDSINTESFFSSVNHTLSGTLEAHYDLTRQLDMASAHAKDMHNRMLAASLIGFLILVAVVIYFLRRRHQRIMAERMMITEDLQRSLQQAYNDMEDVRDVTSRQSVQLDHNRRLMEEMRQRLSDDERRLAVYEKGLRELLQARYELLVGLAEDINKSNVAKRRKTENGSEYTIFMRSFLLEEEHIKNLRIIVNRLYDNVMDDFERALPELSKEQKLVYLYTVSGLSGLSIAALLGIDNVQAVYNKRRKIKNRVLKLDSPIKEKLMTFL